MRLLPFGLRRKMKDKIKDYLSTLQIIVETIIDMLYFW